MLISCLRSLLLENLRMLPHAPWVKIADIPEDSVDFNKEKEAEDEGGEDDKVKRLGAKGLGAKSQRTSLSQVTTYIYWWLSKELKKC